MEVKINSGLSPAIRDSWRMHGVIFLVEVEGIRLGFSRGRGGDGVMYVDSKSQNQNVSGHA